MYGADLTIAVIKVNESKTHAAKHSSPFWFCMHACRLFVRKSVSPWAGGCRSQLEICNSRHQDSSRTHKTVRWIAIDRMIGERPQP